VLIVASALFVSSLPTVATLASEKNFALLRRMFLRSTLRVGQVLVPVIALAWYFTSWLLEQLAPEYAGAVWPFRILSIGAAFMFLNNLATTYIVALGQFRAIMFVSIVNLFVYLLLASSLIPALGAVGAALSTAAMEGCNSLMQVAIVLVLLGRKPRGAAGDAPRPEEPDPAGAGSAAQGR
jgi:O-antigen/teichoic acid export membrane protein